VTGRSELGDVMCFKHQLVLFLFVHVFRHITDTPASEREFQENLHDLDQKINFINLQVHRACFVCVCVCVF